MINSEAFSRLNQYGKAQVNFHSGLELEASDFEHSDYLIYVWPLCGRVSLGMDLHLSSVPLASENLYRKFEFNSSSDSNFHFICVSRLGQYFDTDL